MAPRYGVAMLSLQTEREDGGLYRKLGWVPVERVRYHGVDVTVMERHLKPEPNTVRLETRRERHRSVGEKHRNSCLERSRSMG